VTSPSFDLGEVDAFTAGTVGPPGQRVFFLQARVAGQIVTLKCEKQQVEALGQFLERLLQDLPAPGDGPLPTVLELIEPIEPSWIAGQLGVAWEADLDRFVIAVEELDTTALEQEEDDEDDEDDELPPGLDLSLDSSLDRGTMRLLVTRGQALAFAGRAAELVASGRPACRFCGLPMDPEGHPCPRMN
jgi:uncharacterized repeat protein (TIGR03847 family)